MTTSPNEAARAAARAGIWLQRLYWTLAVHPAWVALLALSVFIGMLFFVISLAWTGRQQAAMNQRLTEKGEELENHLRSLLNSASDSVFNLDRNGNILTWNPAAERMTGHQADAILPRAARASLMAGLRSHLVSPLLEELRKPTSIIFAVTELLHQANLEPEIQECLDLIMSSSQSILKALEGAGDQAKLEAGELAMEPAEFSLRDMLRESLKPFAEGAAHAGQQFDWQVDQEVFDVFRGDSRRLGQALSRVVSHLTDCFAIHDVMVRVQIDSLVEPIALVSFTVEGRGLQKGKIGPALLAAFPDPASSTCRSGRLGGEANLELAKGLIEAMGGSLVACESPDEGAVMRFRVRLQRVGPNGGAVAPVKLQSRRRLSRPEDPENNGYGGKPIMIAGFKDQAQANLCASLQDRGHTVLAVEDESEMLALLEKYNWGGFQLLVVRHEATSESAEEVAEFIRQSASGAGNSFPILMVSPAGVKYHSGQGEEPAIASWQDGPVDEQPIAEVIEAHCGNLSSAV